MTRYKCHVVLNYTKMKSESLSVALIKRIFERHDAIGDSMEIHKAVDSIIDKQSYEDLNALFVLCTRDPDLEILASLMFEYLVSTNDLDDQEIQKVIEKFVSQILHSSTASSLILIAYNLLTKSCLTRPSKHTRSIFKKVCDVVNKKSEMLFYIIDDISPLYTIHTIHIHTIVSQIKNRNFKFECGEAWKLFIVSQSALLLEEYWVIQTLWNEFKTRRCSIARDLRHFCLIPDVFVFVSAASTIQRRWRAHVQQRKRRDRMNLIRVCKSIGLSPDITRVVCTHALLC